MPPLPRTIGAFAVESLVGEGASGTVYRVRRGSEVLALKVLRPSSDPAALARFEREARLLAGLGAAQGFVPLLEVVREPWLCLVMPFVPGGTLRDRLARGPLAVDDALALGVVLARALGEAHARGIVHRDLKPENVLFDAEGRPLVADLGLAKHFRRDLPGASRSAAVSAPGELRGTFAYMAPEQARDASTVGPPADVYSLGAILYECLAGRSPAGGDGVLAALAGAGARPRLRTERPEVSAWLEAVVERALAPNPWERPGDGGELERALAAGPGSRGAAGRVALVAGLAAALVVLGVGIGVSLRRPRPEATTSPAPAVSPAPVTTPATPSSPPVSPPPIDATRGWAGEALPTGLVRAAEKPRYVWKLPGKAGELELVRVPEGEFKRGSDSSDGGALEKPQRTVPMPRAYWIGRTPVTWRAFLAFCAATNHAAPPRPVWAGDDHPVVNTTWDDARAFAEWAGLVLPTNSEWEKAARGTDGRTYPWGEVLHPRWLNFADRNAPPEIGAAKIPLTRDLSADDGFTYTAPVGSFPENVSPYGAVDMAGNVAQWCDDDAEVAAVARPDPPPELGPTHVYRGGSWMDRAIHCMTFMRPLLPGSARSEGIGFRVALRPRD